MITTENRKKLMIYLGYEYFPFNSDKHQLKRFFNHGYWVKESKSEPFSISEKLGIHKWNHEHIYVSKLRGDTIVKHLYKFKDWNQIMQLVKKMNKEDLVWKSNERGFCLPDKLACADMEGTLNTILEILEEFSVI